jgi:hypothetical protein
MTAYDHLPPINRTVERDGSVVTARENYDGFYLLVESSPVTVSFVAHVYVSDGRYHPSLRIAYVTEKRRWKLRSDVEVTAASGQGRGYASRLADATQVMLAYAHGLDVLEGNEAPSLLVSDEPAASAQVAAAASN